MGRIQDEIEDAYYEQQREAAQNAMVARVKKGEFDDIVSVAYKHNQYTALIDARVLSELLSVIKTKL